MVTPLFKGLREEGGTFYTFQPAMKDMTLMFSNTNLQMNFSKFVCLKLPEWGNINKQSLYINPNDLESLNDNSTVDNSNIFFVKRYLQNYAENLNTYLDYNRIDDNFSNTSELALIKSLTSLTGNQTPPLQLIEHSTYLTEDNISATIFRESPDSPDYEQVIQFIGDMNLTNHVKKDGQEYLEIYAHIPTSSGKLIDTQFIKNNNIKPELGQLPVDSTEWIAGQESNYLNSTDKTYTKAVYDTLNQKYEVNSESDLLQIDWDDLEKPESQYKFNNGNFEFNAVLVYYDIFDKNDESKVARNLYGILILDSFTTSSPTTQHIQPFKKYQPNENQSGNSFGFRFNLMFSNSTNTIVSSCTINDYSTISMELYMSALEELKKVSIEYYKISETYSRLAQNFLNIEQTVLDLKAIPSINDFKNIVDEVDNKLDSRTQYLDFEVESILDLNISELNRLVFNIMDNVTYISKTPISVNQNIYSYFEFTKLEDIFRVVYIDENNQTQIKIVN